MSPQTLLLCENIFHAFNKDVLKGFTCIVFIQPANLETTLKTQAI